MHFNYYFCYTAVVLETDFSKILEFQNVKLELLTSDTILQVISQNQMVWTQTSVVASARNADVTAVVKLCTAFAFHCNTDNISSVESDWNPDPQSRARNRVDMRMAGRHGLIVICNCNWSPSD